MLGENALCDLVPASDRLLSRQTVTKSVDLVRPRVEQEPMSDDVCHFDEHFETIVDEVGHAQLAADWRLIAPTRAEANVIVRNPCPLVEAVVFQPPKRPLLDAQSALGDDPDVLAELVIDEFSDRLERVGHGRGLEVVVPEERSVRVVVDPVDDHSADVNSQRIHLSLPYFVKGGV